MSQFSIQKSTRLQAVYDELEPLDDNGSLSDEADGTCTNGYDNDGSTGYEIFQNGVDLAVKAAGRPVFEVETDYGSTLFWIGTEDEIEARMRKRVAEDNA